LTRTGHNGLARIQHDLEGIYRLTPGAPVQDFLVSDELRELAVGGDSGEGEPLEQLLLVDHEAEPSIGLYLHESVLDAVSPLKEAPDPEHAAFPAYLLALEGISHFLYVMHCLQQGRQTSQLELELQAEVDKFVVLLLSGSLARAGQLRKRLFCDFVLEPFLAQEESARYLAANDNAARYASTLSRRFRNPADLSLLLAEVRRFYRASLGSKLARL